MFKKYYQLQHVDGELSFRDLDRQYQFLLKEYRSLIDDNKTSNNSYYRLHKEYHRLLTLHETEINRRLSKIHKNQEQKTSIIEFFFKPTKTDSSAGRLRATSKTKNTKNTKNTNIKK